MARPTKYEERFCEEAREFMADGYSVKAFAGHIGVSLSTVYKWAEEHAEFSEALKAAQASAAYWWESALRNAAITGDGNASAAIFGVKNRSQEEWKDKVEQSIDHTSGGEKVKTFAGMYGEHSADDGES